MKNEINIGPLYNLIIYAPEILDDGENKYETIKSATRSKIVEQGLDISFDEIGHDDYYAVALEIKDNNTKIIFKNNLFSFLSRGKTGNIGDAFIFSNMINYKVISGNVEEYRFKIVNKKIPGIGSKKYRAEIVFSDTYYIDVMANSHDEAKDLAYSIGIDSWTHDWPKDPELDRWQNTRKSMWGKKMINVRQYDA